MLSATAAAFFAGAAVLGSDLVALLLPKMANVGRCGADCLAGASTLEAVFGLGAKSESVGRLGAAFDFGSDLAVVLGVDVAGLGALKKENMACFCGAGVGAGAGGGVFLASGLLKNENDGAGAFLTAGAGLGAGVAFFGSGDASPPKNPPVVFLAAAGARVGAAGAGAAFGAAAFLLPPKRDENASVTGSLVSIFGAGLSFSSGVGAGGVAFLATGLLSKSAPRFKVGRGWDAFIGAGDGAFATNWGFAAGAAGLLSKMEARFSVGRGADVVFGLAAGMGAGGATFFFGAAFLAGAGLLKIDAKLSKGDSFLGVFFFAGVSKTFMIAGASFFGSGCFLAGVTLLAREFKTPNDEGLVAGFFSTGGFLSAASLACFSSHSLALARASSYASSSIWRRLAAALASASAAAVAAAIAAASLSCAAFSNSLACAL